MEGDVEPKCSSDVFPIRSSRSDSDENSDAEKEASVVPDGNSDRSGADSYRSAEDCDGSAEEDEFKSCIDRTIHEEPTKEQQREEAESPGRRSGRTRKPSGWRLEIRN